MDQQSQLFKMKYRSDYAVKKYKNAEDQLRDADNSQKLSDKSLVKIEPQVQKSDKKGETTEDAEQEGEFLVPINGI